MYKEINMNGQQYSEEFVHVKVPDNHIVIDFDIGTKGTHLYFEANNTQT